MEPVQLGAATVPMGIVEPVASRICVTTTTALVMGTAKWGSAHVMPGIPEASASKNAAALFVTGSQGSVRGHAARMLGRVAALTSANRLQEMVRVPQLAVMVAARVLVRANVRPSVDGVR